MDVRPVPQIIKTRCNGTQKQTDITRIKAKGDLVLYEKTKEDWGAEEHTPRCKTHDRNLQHGFVRKFRCLRRGSKGGRCPLKKDKEKSIFGFH
jgi:hypothetical protein